MSNQRRSQTFGLLATVFAFVTLLATPAMVPAQEATPTGAIESMRSLTRDELEEQIVEELGFTDAATPGGTFLDASIGDIQSLHPLLVDEFTSVKVANLLFESLIGNDIRTGQPAPTGLADSWGIAPHADWGTDPGATGSDPLRVIGSGPFTFQEWRQGESVTAVRNDAYHG